MEDPIESLDIFSAFDTMTPLVKELALHQETIACLPVSIFAR